MIELLESAYAAYGVLGVFVLAGGILVWRRLKPETKEKIKAFLKAVKPRNF